MVGKEITFQGHLKIFNRRALESLDNQIKLTIDCVGEKEEQRKLMKQLADIDAEDVLGFAVVKL